jgi:hypothetical protein
MAQNHEGKGQAFGNINFTSYIHLQLILHEFPFAKLAKSRANDNLSRLDYHNPFCFNKNNTVTLFEV